MKYIKYTLITAATLGIIASIYNMIYENSFSEFKTILLALIVIGAALNLEKISKTIKAIDSKT